MVFSELFEPKRPLLAKTSLFYGQKMPNLTGLRNVEKVVFLLFFLEMSKKWCFSWFFWTSRLGRFDVAHEVWKGVLASDHFLTLFDPLWRPHFDH